MKEKFENFNKNRGITVNAGNTMNKISDNIHKENFNLFTSIYIIRMVGLFLSVHIFSRILFNNKVDLENNTLKIILDIVIPFFILFTFRFIERYIFLKKTDQSIDKTFWKQLFLGNWKHKKNLNPGQMKSLNISNKKTNLNVNKQNTNLNFNQQNVNLNKVNQHQNIIL